MGNIISWYNRNRRQIWGFLVAAIIIIIIVYHLINSFFEQSRVEKERKNEASIANNINVNDEMNSITLKTQKSVVTGNGSVNETTIDRLKVLEQFIDFCNNQKIEDAYNLISNECKEEMYSTVEFFKTAYYEPVFGQGSKTVTTENWFGETYKVTFIGDALSTGKYTNEGNMQDYITILKDEEENYKLNINGYVQRKSTNAHSEKDDISINVSQIDSYMEYEIYTVEVKNMSSKIIRLANLKDQYAMYLLDNKNIQYPAYIYELADSEMILDPGMNRKIRIKFYNKYTSGRNIVSLVFPSIKKSYAVNTYADYIHLQIDL